MKKNILPCYTETLGEALDAIRDCLLIPSGFLLQDPDSFDYFSRGGISYETYKQAVIPLYKPEKTGKNFFLNVTLYRMASGRYEIVAYIS